MSHPAGILGAMANHAPDAVLARLAARQHGLVTRRQALESGLSDDHLAARVGAGALVRVHRSVYRISAAPRTWDQKALAACLAVGEGAVLCGRAAASVWQMDLPRPYKIEVAPLCRRGWGASTEEIVVRRVRCLDRRDCTHVGSIPVTTVPRTVVDLSGSLEPEVLARVLDDVIVRRLTSPWTLEATLTRLGGRGRCGAPTLRHALGPLLEGCATGSVAEGAVLRSLAAAGLPPPACQLTVLRVDGAPAVLDFAWPDRMLALEVDGFRWHASPGAHARDSARQNALAALGWTVLRVTPAELAARPGAVLTALRTRLLPGGAGGVPVI